MVHKTLRKRDKKKLLTLLKKLISTRKYSNDDDTARIANESGRFDRQVTRWHVIRARYKLGIKKFHKVSRVKRDYLHSIHKRKVAPVDRCEQSSNGQVTLQQIEAALCNTQSLLSAFKHQRAKLMETLLS